MPARIAMKLVVVQKLWCWNNNESIVYENGIILGTAVVEACRSAWKSGRVLGVGYGELMLQEKTDHSRGLFRYRSMRQVIYSELKEADSHVV